MATLIHLGDRWEVMEYTHDRDWHLENRRTGRSRWLRDAQRAELEAIKPEDRDDYISAWMALEDRWMVEGDE